MNVMVRFLLILVAAAGLALVGSGQAFALDPEDDDVEEVEDDGQYPPPGPDDDDDGDGEDDNGGPDDDDNGSPADDDNGGGGNVAPAGVRRGCTPEEILLFDQQQAQERGVFQQEQLARRKAFKASGPHTKSEQRAFRRELRNRGKAFGTAQVAAKAKFLEDCSRRILPTSLTRPAGITVGQVLVVAAAGLLTLLLLRRLRSKPAP